METTGYQQQPTNGWSIGHLAYKYLPVGPPSDKFTFFAYGVCATLMSVALAMQVKEMQQ